MDGGQSQRTFVYIKDAIEAVLLMIVGSHIQSFYATLYILSSDCRISSLNYYSCWMVQLNVNDNF